jgi:hypothetical protein
VDEGGIDVDGGRPVQAIHGDVVAEGGHDGKSLGFEAGEHGKWTGTEGKVSGA